VELDLVNVGCTYTGIILFAKFSEVTYQRNIILGNQNISNHWLDIYPVFYVYGSQTITLVQQKK
jgi:hypothetical protein